MASCGDIFLYIISFFLPPVGPFFKVGCGIEFWISIGLTLLGFLPGLVYAWCQYSSCITNEMSVLTLRVVCRGHLPVWDAPSPILDEEARSTKGPSAESHLGETFNHLRTVKAWVVHTVAAQSQLQPTVLVQMRRVRGYNLIELHTHMMSRPPQLPLSRPRRSATPDVDPPNVSART